MKIEILGTGCPKCETLAGYAKQAVAQLELDAEIVKITDINEIANRGVMLTPALAVDGEVKFSGRLPNIDEICDALS